MWGEGGDDTLLGGAGDDCLVGGLGADSMVGGTGGDAYYVDSYDDVVVELPGEGTDQMLSTVDIYNLQANVDNLVIYGLAGIGSGNDLDNSIAVYQPVSGPSTFGVTLSGGAGNDNLEGFYADIPSRDAEDYLTGGSGNDYLNGGVGADILEGGLGNDTLVVDNVLDAMREYGYSGNPSVGDTDLVISSVDIDLSDTVVDGGMFIENLTMASGGLTGSGNRLNNVITGSTGDDVLNGELGNDTIYGGRGNDTLDGGDGTDFLRAGSNTSLSNIEVDEITGGAGSNTFDLTDGEGSGFYRNVTGGKDDFGDSSYVVLNDAGRLILEADPRLTWGSAPGSSNTTTGGFYVAKDLTTIPAFGSGFGIFVSLDPTRSNSIPDITDDLIATGPGFTTLASAQAAIDSATYI